MAGYLGYYNENYIFYIIGFGCVYAIDLIKSYPFVKDYQANESKINDIIGKDSISYSFLSIWNKIYWFEI